MRGMDPELNLPLGVKLPVLPSSKPVFTRAKLGEKVKAVERGGRALFFDGCPSSREVPVASCSPAGAAALSSVRRGWGVEGSSWLRAEGTSLHLRGLEMPPGAREELGIAFVPCHSCPVRTLYTSLLQLHRPSCFFDLGDPYGRRLPTEYHSLHDPHLQAFHNRTRNLQRLKRGGYVTSDGQVSVEVAGLLSALVPSLPAGLPSAEAACAEGRLPSRCLWAVSGQAIGAAGSTVLPGCFLPRLSVGGLQPEGVQ